MFITTSLYSSSYILTVSFCVTSTWTCVADRFPELLQCGATYKLTALRMLQCDATYKLTALRMLQCDATYKLTALRMLQCDATYKLTALRMLQCDATYKLTALRMPVYVLLCVDRNGHSQVVAVYLTTVETSISLSHMLKVRRHLIIFYMPNRTTEFWAKFCIAKSATIIQSFLKKIVFTFPAYHIRIPRPLTWQRRSLGHSCPSGHMDAQVEIWQHC